jgi:hypothetical protein
MSDDLSPLYIIWDAQERKFESLLERLRRGVATPLEQAFAAELLENKVVPRRLRRDEPKRFINLRMAELIVVKKAIDPLAPRKKIIGEVAELFGVSTEHVYHIEKEYGAAIIQIEEELRTKNPQELQTLNDLLDRFGAFHCAATWGPPYVAVTDERGHTTVQRHGGGSGDVRRLPRGLRPKTREIIKQSSFSHNGLDETD